MSDRPQYITCLELATLAWPAAVRPEELGPGRISLITETRATPPMGQSAGAGEVTISGAAFDAHDVKVVIGVGGEPGVATFRAWTDGVTLGDETLIVPGAQHPILSSAADPLGLTEGADTGLRVLFGAVDAPTSEAPSYRPGDRWTFTTKPVAAVQAACIAGSGRYRDIVSGPLEVGGARYTGEITVEDPSEKRNVAIFARLQLAESRGVDPGSAAGKLYLDSAAAAELRVIEVARKLRHPRITEEGTPRLAPAVYLGADRGGISAAHRSGCR